MAELKIKTHSGPLFHGKPEAGHETLHEAMPVFWNWELLYVCNYRCTYCKYTVDGWETYESRNVYPGIKRLTEVWDRMFDLYGRSHIAMSGGEPSVYPQFWGLCEMLSRKHSIELNTNLAFDVRRFADTVDLKKVRFAASFHPQFSDFDAFFEKAVYLHQHGANCVGVNYVSYPEQIRDMWRYKKACKEAGLHFHIMSFNGRYGGRIYPDGFTEEERVYYEAALSETDPDTIIDRFRLEWPGHSTRVFTKEIWEDEPHPDLFFQKEKALPRDDQFPEQAPACAERRPPRQAVLCRMGQKYAKMQPNGDVYRCCANVDANKAANWDLLRNTIYLGNLFYDQDFKLLDKPGLCDYDPCPCERCMVVGEESRWGHRWSTPRPFFPISVRRTSPV